MIDDRVICILVKLLARTINNCYIFPLFNGAIYVILCQFHLLLIAFCLTPELFQRQGIYNHSHIFYILSHSFDRSMVFGWPICRQISISFHSTFSKVLVGVLAFFLLKYIRNRLVWVCDFFWLLSSYISFGFFKLDLFSYLLIF